VAKGSGNRADRLSDDCDILLFDLDGVLITTLASAAEPSQALLRLHPDLTEVLGDHQLTIGIITHRTREQALRILDLLDISLSHSRLLVCANDLAYAGMTSLRPLRLLRYGLLKSLALPLLQRDLGILPHQIAVIDDKDENLKDLFGAGCGLTMKSPSKEVVATRATVCFDLTEAVDHFRLWSQTKQRREVTLGEHARYLGDWSATETKTDLRNEQTLFSRARRMGRITRTLLNRIC